MCQSAAFENLDLIYHDASGEQIGCDVFSGNADCVRVPLRQIAKRALLLDASSVFIRHNHPSGNACPSKADIAATREIVSALRLIGVTVKDHQISAGDTAFSFRKAGLI